MMNDVWALNEPLYTLEAKKLQGETNIFQSLTYNWMRWTKITRITFPEKKTVSLRRKRNPLPPYSLTPFWIRKITFWIIHTQKKIGYCYSSVIKSKEWWENGSVFLWRFLLFLIRYLSYLGSIYCFMLFCFLLIFFLFEYSTIRFRCVPQSINIPSMLCWYWIERKNVAETRNKDTHLFFIRNWHKWTDHTDKTEMRPIE